MAGEPILIIDDTPVNLKLTRILLASEGYDVRTAPDAEEGLTTLQQFRPDLILVDIQLPGMDGLEFTRCVKSNPQTRDIVVVALTAFAMKGDEQKATDAGCDGYITKPIDTRALPQRLREYLSTRPKRLAAAAAAAPACGTAVATPDPFHLAGPEIDTLRGRFAREGVAQGRMLLDALEGDFDCAGARKLMHQWVGAAGLLGYPEISQMARDLEQLLGERPLDGAQVRELLTRLLYALSDVPDAQPVPLPLAVVDGLRGKRFALLGFADVEADRMCAAMERVGGLPRLFPASEPPDSEAVRACDLVMIHVRAETLPTAWLAPGVNHSEPPQMLVGDRETLVTLDASVQGRAREFLMDAWQPEEALVRSCLALQRGSGLDRMPVAPRVSEPVRGRNGRPHIVLADDDATVLALVRATLLNYGMEVRTAPDGSQALEMMRADPPDAAILDINMPGADGFELVTMLRSEGLPVRVILLSARQKEADVVRGFTLGADDYVVKPFSPMELVARLKRLLTR